MGHSLFAAAVRRGTLVRSQNPDARRLIVREATVSSGCASFRSRVRSSRVRNTTRSTVRPSTLLVIIHQPYCVLLYDVGSTPRCRFFRLPCGYGRCFSRRHRTHPDSGSDCTFAGASTSTSAPFYPQARGPELSPRSPLVRSTTITPRMADLSHVPPLSCS